MLDICQVQHYLLDKNEKSQWFIASQSRLFQKTFHESYHFAEFILSVSWFNMEDYQNLKYTELQKLAKAAGIKAKGPKVELVNALIAFNNGNEAEGEHEDETKKKPKDTKNKSTKKGKKPVVDVEASPNFPFLLITSTGPAADHMCDTFGLYRKTEEMKEGRNVYKQEHDSKEDENKDDETRLLHVVPEGVGL